MRLSSFRIFLNQFLTEANAFGDLARDANTDPELKYVRLGAEKFLRYMEKNGSDYNARQTAYKLVDMYDKHISIVKKV